MRSNRFLRLPIVASMLMITFITLMSGFISSQAQTGITPTPTLRAVSDDEVNQIAKGLYCPICQNVPLEVCGTAACARWREQVRELIAQGDSETEIRAYFIEHFGPQTVGTPTDSLTAISTIVLPFSLIALVGVVIAVNLVMWRRRRRQVLVSVSQAVPDPLPTTNEFPVDPYRAKLEQEIKDSDL